MSRLLVLLLVLLLVGCATNSVQQPCMYRQDFQIYTDWCNARRGVVLWERAVGEHGDHPHSMRGVSCVNRSVLQEGVRNVNF
jgi:hypothetical protein